METPQEDDGYPTRLVHRIVPNIMAAGFVGTSLAMLTITEPQKASAEPTPKIERVDPQITTIITAMTLATTGALLAWEARKHQQKDGD